MGFVSKTTRLLEKQTTHVSWAFYAPLISSLTLPKVNSSLNPNSNQLEQMKCVVCYLNVLVAG